jgi:alpha-galactosidase
VSDTSGNHHTHPAMLGQPTRGQGPPTAIKLGVVGAGSAVFSVGVVKDMCLTPSLAGSTVHFMDVDAERLAAIHRFAVRYAKELGANLRFEQSTSREAALDGADFVLNTAMLGGRSAQDGERELGVRHGYYRGMYHATKIGENFRQLAFMLDLARDMERLCPRAWLIQSSNPVYEGATLVNRETSIRMIGLCHGYGGYKEIARTLGLDPARVTFVAPGVNHCIWMTTFEHDGRDAYPILDEWIATKAEEYWHTRNPQSTATQMSRAAIDQYRLVGLMPLGDTARTFTEWQYHLDLPTMQRWYGPTGGFDSEIGWAKYLASLGKRIDEIFRAAADETTPLTEQFPAQHSVEQQVPIIDALTNDNRGVFQVNFPNSGAIAGIADDVAVESPAVIDRGGVRMVPIGKLPTQLMLHMLLPRVLDMERTLAAFKTGDRRILESIILWDHRTRTPEQGLAYLDALMELPINRGLRERFGGTHACAGAIAR